MAKKKIEGAADEVAQVEEIEMVKILSKRRGDIQIEGMVIQFDKVYDLPKHVADPLLKAFKQELRKL